jgi:cysteine synthase A
MQSAPSRRLFASALDLVFPDIFLELDLLGGGRRLVLKLEGFNVSGSIKIKTALGLIEDLEARGFLLPGRSRVLESSSGNLGVAAALVCSLRGYPFLCVTDPNANPATLRTIEAYGGEVEVVETRSRGGYVEARIEAIQRRMSRDPDWVWLNQYASSANADVHERTTGPEILAGVPELTHLYVGTGSTGTAMGVAAHFAKAAPQVEVIAVEPMGSVTFSSEAPADRWIPGIGSSRRPEIADPARLSRIVHVAEPDAVAACHWLARRRGLMLGGSSGAVIAAVRADEARLPEHAVVVAIMADLGDRYLETVYDGPWLQQRLGVDLNDLRGGLSEIGGWPA